MKLESLDNEFKRACRPCYNQYLYVENDIILIPNFFNNFERSKKFFLRCDKWEMNSYSNTSKPGLESDFPPWIVEVFL
jgi:hypothetical protein